MKDIRQGVCFERGIARALCTDPDSPEHEALLVLLAGPVCEFDPEVVAARTEIPSERVATYAAMLRSNGLWPAAGDAEHSDSWACWLAIQTKVALGEATFAPEDAWALTSRGRARALFRHPVRAHLATFHEGTTDAPT